MSHLEAVEAVEAAEKQLRSSMKVMVVVPAIAGIAGGLFSRSFVPVVAVGVKGIDSVALVLGLLTVALMLFFSIQQNPVTKYRRDPMRVVCVQARAVMTVWWSIFGALMAWFYCVYMDPSVIGWLLIAGSAILMSLLAALVPPPEEEWRRALRQRELRALKISVLSLDSSPSARPWVPIAVFALMIPGLLVMVVFVMGGDLPYLQSGCLMAGFAIAIYVLEVSVLHQWRFLKEQQANWWSGFTFMVPLNLFIFLMWLQGLITLLPSCSLVILLWVLGGWPPVLVAVFGPRKSIGILVGNSLRKELLSLRATLAAEQNATREEDVPPLGRPVRIEGIDLEVLSKHPDPSAKFVVPLRMSVAPNEMWIAILTSVWNQKGSRRRRLPLGKVSGSCVLIENTTIQQVEECYLPELIGAVRLTNDLYKKHRKDKAELDAKRKDIVKSRQLKAKDLNDRLRESCS